MRLGCMLQPLDDGAAFYHSGQSFVPQASKVDDSWIYPRRHRRRRIVLVFTLGTGPFGGGLHSIAIPTLWWRWRVMHMSCLVTDLARLGRSKIILLARWRTICWHCIWWKVVPSIWRSLVKTAIYITNISARRNTPSWESIWRWTAWQKTIR